MKNKAILWLSIAGIVIGVGLALYSVASSNKNKKRERRQMTVERTDK